MSFVSNAVDKDFKDSSKPEAFSFHWKIFELSDLLRPGGENHLCEKDKFSVSKRARIPESVF